MQHIDIFEALKMLYKAKLKNEGEKRRTSCYYSNEGQKRP